MSDQLMGDNIVNLDNFPLDELPGYVLVVILSFCPEEFLTSTASRVSMKWKTLSGSSTLWKLKCAQLGVYVPPALPSEYRDFQSLCLNNVFGRNLLKNWDARDGFSFWQCYYNRRRRAFHSATGIKVQDSTPKECHGSQPLSELKVGTTKCWAISYVMVTLCQKVDLIEEGLSSDILDDLQPVITISVWTAARFDCASHYILEVSLLGEENGHALEKEIKFTKIRDVEQWGDSSWVKISHSFSRYGKGVRVVKFVHGGTDRQFWAGNYGPKIAAPSVTVDLKGNIKD